MIDPGSLPGQTASLDFGEQSQFNRERQSIASAGRPQAPQPGQQGPPGAQPGPAPQAGGAPGQPVQPAGTPQQQRQVLTPDAVNNQVFSPPARVPYSYRPGLQRAVQRAEQQGVSVPYLRTLLHLSHQGSGTPPAQPT